MKVILINERYGDTRTIVLKGWLKGLISVCLLGAPVALGYLGYQLAVSQDNQGYSQETAQTGHQQLREQAESLAQVKLNAEQQLEALGIHLAHLPARLLRLDALDEEPATLAALDKVRRGEAAALLAGSGHLTSAHLHFDVYKHGRVVDPASYIHRTER